MSNVVGGQTLDVLIAEDSPTQSQQLRYILENQGHRVTSATNGRLAFEAAQRRRPDLLISDVVMPEMTGYELCARIKADERLATVPVILVTTLSDPQDVIRGLECGADNFILKPYDTEHLLHRVRFVMINSQMRQMEQPGMGLEIVFGGQKHFITADRLQILNLLLSTYEAAMQRNKELSSTRDMLSQTNSELQHLTQKLEDRVSLRTRELESTNAALRQAQSALIQQERLRALGQMASGIAHDINNAISPVALYTESMLERETSLSQGGREHLVTIQRAIDDVAQTVARMREFYRPSEHEQAQKEVVLNTLVEQVVNLTRSRWSDMPQRRGIVIELKTQLAPELPNVLGAEHEIRDALTNLIFNAVDAMPEGGKIEVRTRGVTTSGPQGGSDRFVTLEVRDGGIGMDEQTRRRCLEPFFTTKGKRGTGLGLAMVYGMAQRHEATLEVDSEPGIGTTIRVKFPVHDHTATAVLPAAELRPSRSLRILLIDDDAVLIDSLKHTLHEDGHEVTAALGGQAGIDTFLQALGTTLPFEVVITDLGMPHVDGRQVVAKVRAASPHTPIILLTGWGQHVAGDDERPLPVDKLLAKPPRLRELRAALAELAEHGEANHTQAS